jgi:radical SAM/Cys-rich protein
MLKTLQSKGNQFSESINQVTYFQEDGIVSFTEKLKSLNYFPLQPKELEIIQINLGKMCNQVCDHCHVDAGPDRKEIMIVETMKVCLSAIQNSNAKTVDLTGGAPEMNPNFRWFVTELSKLKVKIIVRCNLTIIVANKKYNDLPDFFKVNNIEVISSLPCYTEKNTDTQRGTGVFAKSIKALKMLNDVGYGKEGTGLKLQLVYNPTGISLPPNQEALEIDYKKRLKEDFDIEFNELYTITNMPISRFLDFLDKSGNYENYMQKLVETFNPKAPEELMCRNTLSVGWDGFLYDCDFNQMLDLKIASVTHISDFNESLLQNRTIILNQHCYGCTAGSGSGCGGSLI